MSTANIAASVKARLQNRARETDTAYSELLRPYAMERFLYRLSVSQYASIFVLKGALLFMIWEPQYHRRTTVDIDFLGFTENSLDHLKERVRTICATPVEDDGIIFDLESIRSERIKEDADYEGVRVRLMAMLERSRIPIQIDVGFGDALVPDAITGTLPTLLNFPAPRLRCYQQLTVISEKFQAMVKLGDLNSRMKDFYDVWNIIQHEDIIGTDLQKACKATFERRDTQFSLDDPIWTEEFARSPEKAIQWSAFLRKQGIAEGVPATFEDVTEQLLKFFIPLIGAIVQGQKHRSIWRKGEGWTRE
ncbi:MAG: nucleotidyl transferase AbiEii/AbiGii toxin family protein [Pontiellaceae bacterium]|nr:nucleotidyl transferase AbiEii/AbiGii toxin family protein [Pontiellaceae bacterium]